MQKRAGKNAKHAWRFCLHVIRVMVRVNITPDILVWARKIRGLERSDLVAQLKNKRITEDMILSWEQGTKKPTYDQMVKVAKILNIPFEVFLYPKVPEV